MAFLLLNGTFDEIGTVLPYLFSGEEYNGGNLLDPDQLMQAVGCAVSNLACAPAARDLILELRQPSDHLENGARGRSLRNVVAVTLTAACVIGAVGITGLNAGALFISDRVDALLQ